jgi:isoquinoline 1-oxidoreductase beta subunit
MEPPAAIARVMDGRCEIWAPTQDPQGCKGEAATTLGMAPENVTVHVTLLGGGFGRKSKADFTNEVAFLARAAGVPVRLQWTREDDVRHGYYNTVNAQRLKAGLDERGKVIAWYHRTAFPPIASTFKGAELPENRDLQQGVLDWALDVPNVRAEACPAKGHVRIGWYRSVYNIFHGFGIGSFIDEIAHARGADPRDVLLEVIGPPRVMGLKELGVEKPINYAEPLERHPIDAGRLRNVVERVTASSRFSQQRKAGRALGLAVHRSFVAYTAVVVSVVPDERNKVRVDEAWISMDSGTVVNQERVRAQMAGAVVMGISNALFGGITIKGGATEQSNFHDMRIARIGEVPRNIHVDLVPSEAPPCGVGEPGVPPVAPAVANAIFALTGRRIRELPLIRAL